MNRIKMLRDILNQNIIIENKPSITVNLKLI